MPRIPAFRPATNSSGGEPEARVADTTVNVIGSVGTLLAGGTREGLAITRNKARRAQSAEAQAEGLDPIALAELERERADYEQAIATDAFTRLDALEAELQTGQDGFLTLEGIEPMKQLDAYADSFAKQAKKIAEDISSPGIRAAIDQDIARRQQGVVDTLSAYAAREAQAYKVGTHRAAAEQQLALISQRVETVMKTGSDAVLREGLANGRAATENAARGEGKSDEEIARAGEDFELTYLRTLTSVLQEAGHISDARIVLSSMQSKISPEEHAATEAGFDRAEKDAEEAGREDQFVSEFTLDQEAARKVRAREWKREELDQAHARGDVSPDMYEGLLPLVEEQEALDALSKERVSRGHAFYMHKEEPDRASDEDQAAVDEHFKLFERSLAGDETDIAAIARYIARVGIVPTQVQERVRRGLSLRHPSDGPDPKNLSADERTKLAAARQKALDEAVFSARLVEGLRQRNPKLLGALEEYGRVAGILSRQLNYGDDPDTALRRTIELMDENNPARSERNRQFGMLMDLSEDVPMSELGWTLLISPYFEHDGGFGDLEPFMPGELIDEFKQLMLAHYADGETMLEARRSAGEAVFRRWSVSYLSNAEPRWGDKAFMRDAPELRYGVKDKTAKENAEWIEAQAIDQARAAGVSEQQLKDGIRLEVSPLPGPGGLPVYTVLTHRTGKDGKKEWLPVDHLIFKPDWKTSASNPNAVAKDEKGRLRPRGGRV